MGYIRNISGFFERSYSIYSRMASCVSTVTYDAWNVHFHAHFGRVALKRSLLGCCRSGTKGRSKTLGQSYQSIRAILESIHAAHLSVSVVGGLVSATSMVVLVLIPKGRDPARSPYKSGFC